MILNKCGKCIYWAPTEDSETSGECRYFPPQFVLYSLIKEDEAYHPRHTVMSPLRDSKDHGCGQFAQDDDPDLVCDVAGCTEMAVFEGDIHGVESRRCEKHHIT